MLRAKHKNTKKDLARAKSLRKNLTKQEEMLWWALRHSVKISKFKFRRQQAIRPFIADFACMKVKLVIEVDGPSHDVNWVYVEKRSDYLQKAGFKILRFSNDDVGLNLEGVVATIEEAVKQLLQMKASPHRAKTKDLRQERKSKFSLPLPQGERN